jgi:hypothetical protein
MFDKIFQAWAQAAKEFDSSPWFLRFATGGLRLEHYKGFLLETYHHAGLNPQIQAYCTMFFSNNPRDMVTLFLRHATSEIGHDLLAAKDLTNLGIPEKNIYGSKPLPTTLALNALVTHMIQFKDPICYLGYLFHLEFLPTQNSHPYIEQLRSLGVKDDSLSFLLEHASVDIGHNEMMKKYINYFVKDEKTLDNVIYATQATCKMHRLMLEAAFENGERLFRPYERAKSG